MMAPTRGNAECHVFWTEANTSRPTVWSLLDAGERERARAYRHEPSRIRFVLGRGLARLAVAQVAGVEPTAVGFTATCRHCAGPHGRLEVATGQRRLWLSISHSGTRVGVAVTPDVACGLDIERVALRGGVPPVKALSFGERVALARMPAAERMGAFIRIWTRKEAVLKATGDGLMLSPADLTVSAPSLPARLVAWSNRPPPHTRVHLRDLDVGPRYRACLATLGTPVAVVQHEADERWLAGISAVQ